MWTKKPKLSHNHVNSLHATCVGLIMSGLLYELLLWLDSSSWLVHNGRKRSHNVTSEPSPLRQQIRCGLSTSRVSPHHASPALPPWCLRERRRIMRATTPEARRYARWPFPTLSPLPPPPYMFRTPIQHLGKDGRFPACAAAGINKRPGVDPLPLVQVK
jgi:hypothetical protein